MDKKDASPLADATFMLTVPYDNDAFGLLLTGRNTAARRRTDTLRQGLLLFPTGPSEIFKDVTL